MSHNPPHPSLGDWTAYFRLQHTFDIEVGLAEVLERGPALVVFYVFDFGGY